MAVLPLTDATILVGGTNLTGQSNQTELKFEADELDGTTFGSGGWRSRVGGLRASALDVKGFFAAGDISLPDDALFANLGNSVPASVSPVAPAVGGLAYLLRGTRGRYKWGDQIGALLPFEASMDGDDPAARGVYGSAGVKTATGNGTGLNLGAIPAGSQLVVALHVIAVSGTTPTLTVTVQSDDANTFATPTTQATFTAVTGSGAGSAQYLLASPAATETWFRVNHTIGGTTPSFEFYVTVGIAPK